MTSRRPSSEPKVSADTDGSVLVPGADNLWIGSRYAIDPGSGTVVSLTHAKAVGRISGLGVNACLLGDWFVCTHAFGVDRRSLPTGEKDRLRLPCRNLVVSPTTALDGVVAQGLTDRGEVRAWKLALKGEPACLTLPTGAISAHVSAAGEAWYLVSVESGSGQWCEVRRTLDGCVVAQIDREARRTVSVGGKLVVAGREDVWVLAAAQGRLEVTTLASVRADSLHVWDGRSVLAVRGAMATRLSVVAEKARTSRLPSYLEMPIAAPGGEWFLASERWGMRVMPRRRVAELLGFPVS